MSAQLKAFFDRSFRYYAASYPKSDEVVKKMMHGLTVDRKELKKMIDQIPEQDAIEQVEMSREDREHGHFPSSLPAI